MGPDSYDGDLVWSTIFDPTVKVTHESLSAAYAQMKKIGDRVVRSMSIHAVYREDLPPCPFGFFREDGVPRTSEERGL